MIVPLPDKKYDIILCDPPWNFKTWSKKGKGRSADKHYNCETTVDLAWIDVNSIANDNSVMFMWSTYPKLPEAIALMEAWGFAYKTVAFTWVKKTKHDKEHVGMGYYTRANPEICLLGTKGKILPRVSHSVRNLVIAPIGKHSEKPLEVKRRIDALFGKCLRIELFARNVEDSNWDYWGAEVNGNKGEEVL